LTGSSYTDTNVVAGTWYQYGVRGRNATAYGAWTFGPGTKALAATPGAIATVTTTAAAGKNTVTWTASANASQYVLARRSNSGSGWSGWTTISSTMTARTYTDTNVVAGTYYQYGVRGRNATAYGGWTFGPGTRAN